MIVSICQLRLLHTRPSSEREDKKRKDYACRMRIYSIITATYPTTAAQFLELEAPVRRLGLLSLPKIPCYNVSSEIRIDR